MRTTLAALLLLIASAVSAAPTVTSIEPNVGFTFKETIVTIQGTDFSEISYDCVEGTNDPFCDAQVFFGPTGVKANVTRVTPTTITARVPPRPHGEQGPILVIIRGRGDAVLASGFRWDQAKTSDNLDDYVRYLIPITTNRVPGANGSLWSTEWVARNSTDTPFAMIWDHCPPNVSPCPDRLMPAQTTTNRAILPRGDGTDGAFLYVPKPMAPPMSLRVRDLSRNAQSFGTELPIVPDSDYRSTMELLDIPTDPNYRATLRVYGPGPEPHYVHVSVFSEPGGQLIERYQVELSGMAHVPEGFALHPAYAQLDPLTPAVRAAGERVRIVVHSEMWWSLVSPPPPWPAYAFLTITNNETQQVTTVTPKP
jgi:hypothetical protein